MKNIYVQHSDLGKSFEKLNISITVQRPSLRKQRPCTQELGEKAQEFCAPVTRLYPSCGWPDFAKHVLIRWLANEERFWYVLISVTKNCWQTVERIRSRCSLKRLEVVPGLWSLSGSKFYVKSTCCHQDSMVVRCCKSTVDHPLGGCLVGSESQVWPFTSMSVSRSFVDW